MAGDTLGGTYTMAEGLTVHRMGYGAMQLAGPGVFGPPKDRDEAIAVLRTAVELGVDHIDTADFYGPHVTNELIREALAPYGDDLHIVTKVGAVRDEQGGWPHARSPEQLRQQVESNLRTLGVDVLDVVNLRVGGGPDGHSPVPGSIAEPFGALAEMREQGLIRHLGISVVDEEQVREAQSIAPVVTVQNWYNVVHRGDERLIASLAEQGISYVPFWPLGGFSPIQSETLETVAKDLGASPQAVALAWLLHQSPNICVIPGTSSVAHLRENIAAASLELPEDALATLDGIAG
ncbi:oxidoreductase [Saccharomonospora glauca]|jgi:pyridoxine 4-dehydrogenase|uniref:Putative oxidoreductase, aryl-alcohol dehydrogenase like protein n=1 Tax=Saccharomonospora glauca K62 TaxID=928724 RepID=I1D0L5_9PSEU|nr:oxidoreductase [Saccharomonospora glauca]EIE98489.1 putative oxidoreductase, aryl-alcohol dehydrogenase like protein [Saccharomonospora glauca K62]